jgi:glycosyltransferase involved in cell wall biosynthesis
MPSDPKIAVVTAAYNVGRFIDATIHSVFAQTFPDFEYVIVDDKSTDGTLAIAESGAREDARLRVLRRSANLGPGAARNLGVRATTAPFIAFIDGDDCWEPDFLRVMHDELLRQSPDCVGVFCHSAIIDENGIPGGTIQSPAAGRYEFFDFFRHIFPPGNGSAFLLHRRYFEESGGFSDIRSLEDLDLYLRLLQVSGRRHLMSIPRVLVRYRQLREGLASNGRLIEIGWRSKIEHHVEQLPAHKRWVIYFNFSKFYGPRSPLTHDLGTRMMRRALLSRKSLPEFFHSFGPMLLPASMGWKRYLALRKFFKSVRSLAVPDSEL